MRVRRVDQHGVARDAAADLRTLEARIDAASPADDALQLAAGSAALKLFVAELGTEDAAGEEELPDIAALAKAMETADSAAARAEEFFLIRGMKNRISAK